TSEGKKGPDLTTVPEEFRDRVKAAAPPELGGDGTFVTVPLGPKDRASRLYVFGVGKSREMSPRKARVVLRSAVRMLAKMGETSAIVDFPFSLERMSAAESRDFVLRSIASGAYTFTDYKSNGDARSLQRVFVNPSRGPWAKVPAAEASREAKEARHLAEAVKIVRDLGNTPSNDLVPRQFAERARREAKARGIKVRVLDKKAIEREKMGGLLAVNRGAKEEPRFVVLEYHGAKKSDAPVALVGKGITFDSGGISLKPSDRMGDMKWDMMGAATVLGAILAASDLDLPVNLVGLLPMTENMPSGSAYKPGDVVRFRNGKTAEIDNTDAEGRVILADALDYAREWKPAAIVDFATLTGAALVALGLEAAIVFTPDDALAAELISAGERTDERLWRLPVWDDYKENIRSDWADFKNTGGRTGGSINGAMFLKEFVDPKTPWAHVDIAATAYYEREYAGYPVGSSGFGVALTIRWLRDRLAKR
ncbi:MAG TPA: leucyl aminopeptidase, partial [Thermoanaerobaculia bacterium]|nr:leucyl aminopeptidase [Thermoanaerobaculia bacterium]